MRLTMLSPFPALSRDRKLGSMLQAQGDQRQRPGNQQEAEAAERAENSRSLRLSNAISAIIQRHDQADAHQVVAHGFADATARPAEVRDKQTVRARKGGANHHHPQRSGTVAVTLSPIATASGWGHADCGPCSVIPQHRGERPPESTRTPRA